MSKSDNIYNALDFARNKLKSAAEAKGAAVASPYSLMDIAAAVQTIENGLEVGVLVSDSTGLKVQPLEFSGTSAMANGTAESYAARIFNTGKDEPAYASGSGDTSAFESDAMAIIGTPTGGGGESGDEIVTLVSESGSQGQSKVAINATGSVIVTNGSASQTYTEFPAEFTLSAGTTTIQGTVTTLNCTTSTLTSIDISLCPTLTSLDCKGNALSALDISNNANLVTLACNNNGLTMLNIAQNTALKYLAAYSNKFTSDVVNNILAALVSNAKTDGTLDINYQEISAPPTGQGLADKQTLIDRGWTVTTD
jgi:hypothetical protein